jgi:hypothetical protein
MNSIRVTGVVALSLVLTACLALSACGGGSSKDFCEANCAAVVAAGCTNGPVDQTDCLTGCNSARSACPTQFNTLASCAGSSASFTCDANDSPSPVGCDTQNLNLSACLEGVSDFCIAVCPAVVAAGCSNGPGDLMDCLSGCADAEASCPTEFQAMAQCAGTSATFACDGNDSPAPAGCQTENDALMLCMQ